MRTFLAALALALLSVGSGPPFSGAGVATCRAETDATVHWLRTAPEREYKSIDRWCAGVGPPARVSGGHASEILTGPLVIATWNTHVGAGDIDGLVGDLRSGRLTGAPVSAFVLLVQEAYRAGPDVPALGDVSWAAAEGADRPGHPRVDAIAAARRLGLSAVYVPSMRNGRPGVTQADRGNAILSSLPIGEVTAIELPLERQRRVAIQATIAVDTRAGPLPLRVVCTHFTNTVMHHLWLLSEAGRLRQARALSRVLPEQGAIAIGGDFNAWFGFLDAAYRQMAERARAADTVDRRATFGPLRLDHMLFRLPTGWQTRLRRADRKYGSDHYPLVTTVIEPAG
jgi:endonuclease/exonuclease/phosphatase family metal-dependent hydrolase